jgi:hypothetical protein
MSGPNSITLPSPPTKPEDLKTWAVSLYKAIQNMMTAVIRRHHDMIIEGVVADMPSANGSRRFYFATDTSKLYYDGGASWVILN